MNSFKAWRNLTRKISQSYVDAQRAYHFYSVLSPEDVLNHYRNRMKYDQQLHDFVQTWIGDHIRYERKNIISNAPIDSGGIRSWYESDRPKYRISKNISFDTYISKEDCAGALIYAGYDPVGSDDSEYVSYFFFEVKYVK